MKSYRVAFPICPSRAGSSAAQAVADESFRVDDAGFQRDKNLSSGYRAKCKACLSMKGTMTKKKRERVVEDNGVGLNAGIDAVVAAVEVQERGGVLTAPAVIRVTVPQLVDDQPSLKRMDNAQETARSETLYARHAAPVATGPGGCTDRRER